MASHADHIRDLERAVVEAAVDLYHEAINEDVFRSEAGVCAAVDTLLALRAATCPTCGGSGGEQTHRYGECPADSRYGRPEIFEWVPCPAGCDHGRKVSP